MLPSHLEYGRLECGLDEAGRGCLAGPVFAAAVILPEGFEHEYLMDSKKLKLNQRLMMREIIQNVAVSWAIAKVDAARIDEINILRASFEAMHIAIGQLDMLPEYLLVDGHLFYNQSGIPQQCIVKGDGKIGSIAAASILAKTYRDDFMKELAATYPEYGWNTNVGYGTIHHRKAMEQYGKTPLHRLTFQVKSLQIQAQTLDL